jgi:hypothetical protein
MKAAEKATGEICQFLNDHMERGVPVEWHTRIRDIIERSCGQNGVTGRREEKSVERGTAVPK